MQSAEGTCAAAGGVLLIVWLGIVILMIASMWRIFTKAGQPGWGCIIPYTMSISC
jgi:hypothetical protein